MLPLARMLSNLLLPVARMLSHLQRCPEAPKNGLAAMWRPHETGSKPDSRPESVPRQGTWRAKRLQFSHVNQITGSSHLRAKCVQRQRQHQ